MRLGKALVLTAITVLLLASASLPGKPVAKAEADHDGLYVVCMTTVLASIVEQIGGPYVEVEAIVPAGFCPGHYDMRPSDVEAVSKADILLGHIAVFPWVEKLLQAAGRSVSDLIMLHGAWNTPEGAISYVKNITDILCSHPETNSTMASYFTEMNATICSELQELASYLKARAEELGVGSVKVICMQWQVPFVSWLGFNITATFPPPESMSPKDIEALVSKGKEEGVAIVIDNLQSGTEVGTEVAREIGAEHVVLTNFPGAAPGTKTLADMFRHNAYQLFNATARWQAYGGMIRQLKNQIESLKSQNTLFLGLIIGLAVIAIAEAVLLIAWRRRT
ncbi:hypothetical protein B6U66_00595 [Candidatus Bathyarchaeota archaeon ex4484_135]|mgnify:CR=1 FL=1|nr:MAG: hypothetical protein B6U66_00595 [Candidatus Bathyarchaeota archaeon ex4484_135]